MAELTVYPDAGTGGNSVDGHMFKTAATWALARDATSGGGPSESGGTLIVASQEETGEFTIFRAFATFDTSPIGAGATITAVVLSLFGTGTAVGNPTVHCIESTQASDNALVAADYDNIGSTSFANVSSWSDIAYNVFTLSAAGRAIIDLTGVSKYSIREGHDQDNSEPGVADVFSATMFSADEAGTTKDPKLVITYTPPAPASGFFSLLS